MKEYIIAAEKFETVLGQCLSPLQGRSVVAGLPTAGAVGCILAPLRGWVRFFRRFAAGYGSAPLHGVGSVVCGWVRFLPGPTVAVHCIGTKHSELCSVELRSVHWNESLKRVISC